MGAEPTYDWAAGVASALEWWADAGVDTLQQDDARDWLARPAATATKAAEAVAEAAPPSEILPTTLEDFVAWRMSAAAPEAAWMSRLVAPLGAVPARLTVMVDMPEGDDGDSLLGGAAGRLFDRMLAAIGLTREDVYLCAFAWAPPIAKRIPADHDARLVQLARHHLTLLRPTRLLLLGQAAARTLGEAGGQRPGDGLDDVNLFGGNTRVVPSYHPRFLLDHPAAKGEAWKHLLLLSQGGL